MRSVSSSASTPRATTSGSRGVAREPDVREHLRAADAPRAVRSAAACGRPTSSRTRSSRRPFGRRPARSARPGRLRDRRPSPRLGNAAVRRPTTSAATPTRWRCRPNGSSGSSTTLTDAIEAAVGARPVSYRSGRFGFSASHVSALERAGYLVESSIAPLFYETHKGGPDFVEAPLSPTFSAYDDARRPGTQPTCWSCPVSAALNRRYPAWLQHRYARAPWPYTTKRVLRKLGIARMLWLRPSYSSLDGDEAAGAAAGRQTACRCSTCCSIRARQSSAAAPTIGPKRELEAFFERLDRFLAIRHLGAGRRAGDVRRVPGKRAGEQA